MEEKINFVERLDDRKNEKPYYDNSVTVEQMKTNLNIQLISGIAAAGTTLLLLKGGEYKWIFITVFAVILFIFVYIFNNNKKGSG